MAKYKDAPCVCPQGIGVIKAARLSRQGSGDGCLAPSATRAPAAGAARRRPRRECARAGSVRLTRPRESSTRRSATCALAPGSPGGDWWAWLIHQASNTRPRSATKAQPLEPQSLPARKQSRSLPPGDRGGHSAGHNRFAQPLVPSAAQRTHLQRARALPIDTG